jgi:polynucleotide 5'-kinase involved in rRNA processing
MRHLVVGPRGVGKTVFCQRLCRDEATMFLNLDPARQTSAPLCCAELFDSDMSPLGFRFIGSLIAWRDPIAMLNALDWAMETAGDQPLVVELTISTVGAVAVHALRAITERFRPSQISSIGFDSAAAVLQPFRDALVQEMSPLTGGTPYTPQSESAWRKAKWKGTFENCNTRAIPITGIQMIGSRIGSGARLDDIEMIKLREIGLTEAAYAEVIGRTLYAIFVGNADSETIGDACREFDCQTAHLVHPRTFVGLVCGLETQNGIHSAVGRVKSFDGDAIQLEAPSVSFDSLWRLRMGRVRLDVDENELGELRAWQV